MDVAYNFISIIFNTFSYDSCLNISLRSLSQVQKEYIALINQTPIFIYEV